MEVLDAIKFLLTSGWTFLSSVMVPGFNFSFGTLLLGLFLANLGLRFLFMILGVSVGRGDVENVERIHTEKETGKWPLHFRRYK